MIGPIVAEAAVMAAAVSGVVALVPHRLDLERADAAGVRHRGSGHAGEDHAGEDVGVA